MIDVTDESKTIATIMMHTRLVVFYMQTLAHDLVARAQVHDLSKLGPDEFSGFVQINRVAREHKYGSPEYMAAIEETGAVPLHWSRNSHHPERHPNGVQDMSLAELIEMVADWKAASVTYGKTSFLESVEVSAERFKLTPEQLYVVRLIAQELEK